MSFENKTSIMRPASKTKNYLTNKESNDLRTFNPNMKKKKQYLNDDLKRELEEAENYLNKANEEFMLFKSKEKGEIVNNDEVKAIRFIENTLKENKKSDKIPLRQFLKDNEQIFETVDKNFGGNENKLINSNIYQNNVENSNFDHKFNLSSVDKESEQMNKEIIDDISLEKPLNQNTIPYYQDNSMFMRYKKQLKSNGFPEIGNVFFLSDTDQESLFKFFDYVIIRKSNESGDRLKLKKHCEELKEKLLNQQNDFSKLERENIILNENNRKIEKENRFLNEKMGKIKQNYEKTLSEMKTEINRYKNKFNFLQVEKKSHEEKLAKMSENYQKFLHKMNQNNSNVSFNKAANIEFSITNKKNEVVKILSKVSGTEKLIQTIKNGYNESLRELLFEITALKTFILEINSEIIEYAEKLEIKNLIPLEKNFINMPFLECVPKIKYALKSNIKKSFDFWSIDEPKELLEDEFEKKENLNHPKKKTEENFKDFINSHNSQSEKDKIESISIIREKNDSIFEIDKNKDVFVKNKNDNLFDQSNYDPLIDFDIENFELEMSENETKVIKKNLKNKDNIVFESELEKDKIEQIENRNKQYIFNKTIDNENYLADRELEILKEKWMKALTG